METDPKTKHEMLMGILRFLRRDANESDPELREPLELARQCLELAFDIYPDYSDEEADNQNKAPVANKKESQSLIGQLAATPAYQIKTPATGNKGSDKHLIAQSVTASMPQIPQDSSSEEDSSSGEEYNSMANQLCTEKNYQDAIPYYDKAINANPEDPVYLHNRAVAHYNLGNHAQCIADCELCTELDPNYAKAYARLGKAYFVTFSFRKSQRAYGRAIELEPGNSAYKKSLKQIQDKLDKVTASIQSQQVQQSRHTRVHMTYTKLDVIEEDDEDNEEYENNEGGESDYGEHSDGDFETEDDYGDDHCDPEDDYRYYHYDASVAEDDEGDSRSNDDDEDSDSDEDGYCRNT